MIGKRLILARTAIGLSLRELEAKIGNLVTAQAIGKYERDESMPSSGVLLALAKALDVSVDYLLGNAEIELEAVEFRKKAIATKRDESQVKATALQLLERYLAIESLLNLSSQEWNKPREAPYPANEIAEADRAARSLREHWSLGVDPIPDLMELLEEQGIKILALDQAGIDGLMARVVRPGKSAVPIIAVNAADCGERQRFTLAHELGHLVLEPAMGLDVEKVAHRFAGAFLMPAEAMWREIGKHRTQIGLGELFRCKKVFGVSAQALTYRCRDLGIFPEGLFKALFQEFGRRGWRTPPYKEPDSMGPQTPKRFARLCLRALAENAISESRAAELLGVSVHDLQKEMDEPNAAIAQ